MFFKCIYCQKRHFFPSGRLECHRQHRRENELALAAAEWAEREQDQIFAAENRRNRADLAKKRQTAYRPPSRIQSNNYGERDRHSSDPLLYQQNFTPDESRFDDHSSHCRSTVEDSSPPSSYESSSNDSCSGGDD